MQPLVIASSKKVVAVVSIFMLWFFGLWDCGLWVCGLESVAFYSIVLGINRGGVLVLLVGLLINHGVHGGALLHGGGFPR